MLGVVLTHLDCCVGRDGSGGWDVDHVVAGVHASMHGLVDDWSDATPVWCINSLNPSHADPIVSWLVDQHGVVAGGDARIPRLCQEMEEPLKSLRWSSRHKVSCGCVAWLMCA